MNLDARYLDQEIVLAWIASGKTPEQVAHELGIPISVVETAIRQDIERLRNGGVK